MSKSVKQILIDLAECDILNESDEAVYYHGSPVLFKIFNTPEVFLAKDPAYAKRYGGNVYEVTIQGRPMFETPTILVVKSSQVKRVELIKAASGNERIYGK